MTDAMHAAPMTTTTLAILPLTLKPLHLGPQQPLRLLSSSSHRMSLPHMHHLTTPALVITVIMEPLPMANQKSISGGVVSVRTM
jgi:hypothetical protein